MLKKRKKSCLYLRSVKSSVSNKYKTDKYLGSLNASKSTQPSEHWKSLSPQKNKQKKQLKLVLTVSSTYIENECMGSINRWS